MAAFATSQDMVTHYSVQTLGDLCADDGTRVPEGSLATDPKMVAALDYATGKVVAACLRAGRYTRAQLEGLTGESRAYLARITCCIAYWNLWGRKTWSDKYESVMREAKQSCTDALEALRSGDEIFEIESTINAGKPRVYGPSAVQIRNEYNLITDHCRPNFYPVRRTARGI